MKQSVEEVQGFMDREFPGHGIKINSIEKQTSLITKEVGQGDLRPGNTISGPTMMSLVDTAIYVAIIGELGLTQAVTTHLSIDFLKKPDGAKNVIGKGTLIKISRSSVFGHVELFSQGCTDIIAFATVNYALPRKK